jgi:hypothetical protein
MNKQKKQLKVDNNREGQSCKAQFGCPVRVIGGPARTEEEL